MCRPPSLADVVVVHLVVVALLLNAHHLRRQLQRRGIVPLEIVLRLLAVAEHDAQRRFLLLHVLVIMATQRSILRVGVAVEVALDVAVLQRAQNRVEGGDLGVSVVFVVVGQRGGGLV